MRKEDKKLNESEWLNSHVKKNEESNLTENTLLESEEKFRLIDINEIKVLANQINSTAQNAHKLLDDLLVWARTQQGSISFKPQILNLHRTG